MPSTMTRPVLIKTGSTLVALLLAVACSGSDKTPKPPVPAGGSGGGTASGGSGGSNPTGGSSGSGGYGPTGGSSGSGGSAPTGGSPGTGGTTPPGGDGGSGGSTPKPDAGGGGSADTGVPTNPGTGGTPGTPAAVMCTEGGTVPTLKKTNIARVAGAQETASPPDSPDEVWVLGHFTGNVSVVKGGMLLPTPIVHVDVRQNPPGKEQGLLSIAFDPKYAENKTFYLFYSAAAPTGQTTIQAFKRTGDLTAMAGEKIWDKPHPHMFHNGGQIKFGPDGKLYLSIGNNAAPAESQKAEGLYGRILQIDVASKMGKTWDMGLRNPYRFTFDPQTFDIYIGDVGDGGGASEKFFFEAMGQGGKNWGYRGNDNRTGVEYIDQIASGGGAGIGGVVYRGKKMPGLCGRYFYGHYSNGTVFSVKMEGGKPTDKRNHPELTTAGLSSFGIDAAGEIYMGSLNGPVNRIDPAM
jgi:hypothetical protein